ncbi:unnamed protein product [Microthlaspi erraticum]|uniref:F-box domain-containing protein n=1 Tax=Microthlaspi erraticum TaxID=1685480 RepID=A0A6D2JVG3_9BRAS|nr:unnamed protein product [Microthlaspi erraticum]
MMIADLPQDLESIILSRVPAKAQRQVRFTCKRWNALFKDPKFLKNIDKARTQVILKIDLKFYSGIINLHGIHNSFDHSSLEFTGELQSLKASKHVEIFDMFHCDGLLLCTANYDRLVVWNPCTGQSKRIDPINRIRGYFTKKYILGYENNKSSTGSYKIVCFILDSDIWRQHCFTRVEIYESNSGSWRVLDDVIHPYRFLNVSRGMFNASRGVSLKGNTYWFDIYNEYHRDSSIVMFDFTTEKLGRLSLPFTRHNYETVVLSVVREEKLAVLRYDNGSLEMKIWLTTNTKIDEAKDLSWSEFLVVDLGKVMVQSMNRSVSFLVVDEENKMVVCCDHFYMFSEEHTRIYIVGEHMHKLVYEKETTKRTPDYLPLLLSYVPSLAHI